MGALIRNAVLSIVAGAAGGLVAFSGNMFNYWNRDRELDIRMVDVALTILSSKDGNGDNIAARRYALDVLDKYGGVTINNKEDWAQTGRLPVGNWPYVSGDGYLTGTARQKQIYDRVPSELTTAPKGADSNPVNPELPKEDLSRATPKE